MVSPFDLSRTLLVDGGLLVVFLTRISCHKTTHANGYYGAWPGWAVLISVSPNSMTIFSGTRRPKHVPHVGCHLKWISFKRE